MAGAGETSQSNQYTRYPRESKRHGKWISKFIEKTSVPRAESLPFDVRYALQYRGSKLTGAEIAQLREDWQKPLAFYLAMKAAAGNTDIQAQLLKRLADIKFDYREVDIKDLKPALDFRASQPETTVNGNKIPQYSRQGSLGIRRFDTTLTGALEDKPDATLFMVADYPYVALDVLASHSLAKGNPLGILNPDLFGQTQQPVGFIFEHEGGGITVKGLNHDFERPEGAVIFDDAILHGNARNNVLSFWALESDSVPDFVAAVTNPEALPSSPNSGI